MNRGHCAVCGRPEWGFQTQIHEFLMTDGYNFWRELYIESICHTCFWWARFVFSRGGQV